MVKILCHVFLVLIDKMCEQSDCQLQCRSPYLITLVFHWGADPSCHIFVLGLNCRLEWGRYNNLGRHNLYRVCPIRPRLVVAYFART